MVREEDFMRLREAAHTFLLKYNFDFPLWDQDDGVEEVVEEFKYVLSKGKKKVKDA